MHVNILRWKRVSELKPFFCRLFSQPKVIFLQKQFRFQLIAFLPVFKERTTNGRRKLDLKLFSSTSLSVHWGGSSGAEFSITSERAADLCRGCSFRWRGYWWMCKGLEPSCIHSPTFGGTVFGRLLWACQAGCGGMCRVRFLCALGTEPQSKGTVPEE